MNEKKKNIALVLSGGGARGLAHIGVIEVLLERGYIISSVSGTSIGSVVGGIYAAGKLQNFKEWITNLNKLDVIKLMDFVITKNGFIKGEKVFGELNEIIGNELIEDLSIPFATVAVDINKHKEVVFTSGKLKDAIRASIAVPTVLTPFILNSAELVDGGVLNPLPLDLVYRIKNDILLASDLMADIPYPASKKVEVLKEQQSSYQQALDSINEKWSKFFKSDKQKRSGFFNVINNSISAMEIKLTQLAIEKHQPDILIRISKDACDMFEFYRADELIEYGREQALKSINLFEKYNP
jgi:NTE family protein